jgi:hypothetical protein
MVTHSVLTAEADLTAELEQLAASAGDLQEHAEALEAIIRHTSDELWDLQQDSRTDRARMDALSALLLEPAHRGRARQISRQIAELSTREHFRDQLRARVAQRLHEATIAANCTDGRMWRVRRQISAMLAGPEELLEDLPF